MTCKWFTSYEGSSRADLKILIDIEKGGDILELLVKHNSRRHSNKTSLHWALSYGFLKLILFCTQSIMSITVC